MVYTVEKIEERVRNMVGPFYNMATILKNLNDPKIIDYLNKNHEKISQTMYKSIEYLIEMSAVIDCNLPEEFDINKIIDKSKYQL